MAVSGSYVVASGWRRLQGRIINNSKKRESPVTSLGSQPDHHHRCFCLAPSELHIPSPLPHLPAYNRTPTLLRPPLATLVPTIRGRGEVARLHATPGRGGGGVPAM